jgi:hypothetical protein
MRQCKWRAFRELMYRDEILEYCSLSQKAVSHSSKAPSRELQYSTLPVYQFPLDRPTIRYRVCYGRHFSNV